MTSVVTQMPLGLALGNLCKQIDSELSKGGGRGIISDAPTHRATVKITSQQLDDHMKQATLKTDGVFSDFKETLIDALACLRNERLDTLREFKPVGLEGHLPLFEEILGEAKRREVGSLFMYPLSACYQDKSAFSEGCFGVNVDDNGCLAVNTWIRSAKCENWQRHYPAFFKKAPSEAMPVRVFFGKREGDTVEFDHEDKHVKVTLLQNEFRYGERRHGRATPFENMMKSLLKRPGYYLSSPEEQRRQELVGVAEREAYYASMGWEE